MAVAHAQSTSPLTLEDALVLAPAPSAVQERIVQRRCVAFAVDAAAASRLRAARATDAYVTLLRDACETEFRDAEAVNTADSYRTYVSRYPRGRFVTEARRRLGVQEDDGAYRVAIDERRGPVYKYYALQRYLRAYPNGRNARDAEREAALIVR